MYFVFGLFWGCFFFRTNQVFVLENSTVLPNSDKNLCNFTSMLNILTMHIEFCSAHSCTKFRWCTPLHLSLEN